MTIVVGWAPDDSGISALELAGMLASSTSDELLVCTIVTASWPSRSERIDVEFRELLANAAQRSLSQARARVSAAVDADFLVHHARSVPTGLMEIAAIHGADMVVLGSASGGAFGQVSLGSVTDRILHSSHVPVALAPRGFRCGQRFRMSRITAAVGGAGNSRQLLEATGSLAVRAHAHLRAVSFAVSPPPGPGSGVEPSAEDLVVNEWIRSSAVSIQRELAALRGLPGMSGVVDLAIGHGFSWREALDDISWSEGDVLAIGSSVSGPGSIVFLGSRASKILRHSPVPVLVVPRG